MTLYEIPRIKRFRGQALVRRTNSIVRPRRRLHSWFRGWRDGRSGLNGSSSAAEFRDACNFLKKTKAHADGIGSDCERAIAARTALLEETLAKLKDRSVLIDGAVAEHQAAAEGMKCERPSSSPASYHRLLVFLFIAEVAFSFLNLMYADMGGLIVEGILSFVFAGCLVGLSDAIGKRYRKLPLPLDAPEGARTKAYLELFALSLCLVAALCALTYLRARGMRGKGDSGNADLFTEIALFVIGFGFLAYSAWIAGQIEYSGPKHGLARLERLRFVVADLIKAVESELKGIGSFRDRLSDLLARNKERVTYIYVDQYKRHERHA